MAGSCAFPSSLPSSSRPYNNIGLSFLRRYYIMLSNTPEEAYNFFKETSSMTVSHHLDDVSEAVQTQKNIKAKLEASGFKGSSWILTSVDCQDSYAGGIVVLVSGVMKSEESLNPRRFMHCFVLGPQPNGLFVRNDILRFLDNESPAVTSTKIEEKSSPEMLLMCPVAPQSAEQEEEDKENMATAAAHMEDPCKNKIIPNCDDSPRSICIKNLPLHITTQEIGDLFSQFGAIKLNGIHIRIPQSCRQQGIEGFSYAFVQFESTESFSAALKRRVIDIKGRNVRIEEKRKPLPHNNSHSNTHHHPRFFGKNIAVNSDADGVK